MNKETIEELIVREYLIIAQRQVNKHRRKEVKKVRGGWQIGWSKRFLSLVSWRDHLYNTLTELVGG